ncbi:MAG TPA: DEAD/DEAH box helicase [Microthrixaceae bacterium]|nr:DEAD/DEAH box helicase [Microthrixaceae bacterium]
MNEFEAIGVPAEVARSLHDRGITAPFPIQTATIPAALAGKDVCGKAPTGAGKTLAFGIPLMQRVGRAYPGRPRGLVLAPTRELASQICEELRQLAGPDQTVEPFYGGVGFGKQLRALRDGVDVAVACPGRLADLIQQGHMKLQDVDMVVLDEADRMADMGFLHEVKRLLDACADKRQTLLFSATLDGDVDVLIKRYMNNPVKHEEAGAEPEGEPAEHFFWSVERADRLEVTAKVVARTGPTIVFCRTKRGADRVARQLSQRGVSAVAIHGDRSQNQRERALSDFRGGRARAIVATDVAARGIHVDGVACVIHFDPSEDPKDYVHRSGRTGRAGAAGSVISFVGGEQRRDMNRQQRSLGRQMDLISPDVEGLPEGEPFKPVAPRPESSSPRSSKPGGRPGGRPRNGGAGKPRNRAGGKPGGQSRRNGASSSGGVSSGGGSRSAGASGARRSSSSGKKVHQAN